MQLIDLAIRYSSDFFSFHSECANLALVAQITYHELIRVLGERLKSIEPH